MKQIDLTSSEWLEMLFEGRNKEYGAYVIRRDTGKRNFWAIVALGVLFALAMALIYVFNFYNAYKNAHVAHEEVVELYNMPQKEPAKVERVTKPQDPENIVEKARNSIKFTAPRIEKDENVRPQDEMITQDALMATTTAIGTFTVTNGSEDGEVIRTRDAIAQPEPKKEEVIEKPVDVAEIMPAFPGGTAELMAYLSKNIKYPVICQENGTQGRVVCAFVVEKDGSITDVHVVRSVDPNLDKEAMRVIKSMPKWIPGRQNGTAVRVKYNVPVMFRLQ